MKERYSNFVDKLIFDVRYIRLFLAM